MKSKGLLGGKYSTREDVILDKEREVVEEQGGGRRNSKRKGYLKRISGRGLLRIARSPPFYS